MSDKRAGWKYYCAPGEFKRWTHALPNGDEVEVYYNTDISFSNVDPPVKWEFDVWRGDYLGDMPIPDECKTLTERLNYAIAVARTL